MPADETFHAAPRRRFSYPERQKVEAGEAGVAVPGQQPPADASQGAEGGVPGSLSLLLQ